MRAVWYFVRVTGQRDVVRFHLLNISGFVEG